MGSIKIKETESLNGIIVVVEYEFSDYNDFLDFTERRNKALKDAIGSLYGEEASAVVDINVKKKDSVH